MPFLLPPITFVHCSLKLNCLVLGSEWVCKLQAYSCSSWKTFKVILFKWINEVRFFSGHDCVGRHRWVEYAQKGRYNASQVPPEWHGWLHFITDHTGDEVSHCSLFLQGHLTHMVHVMIKMPVVQLLLLKPKRYGVEHKENFSGEGEELIYHSKGHSLNPGQRDWTRYQPWQPTKP